MLRHVLLGLTLSVMVGTAASAGPIEFGTPNPYGPTYSPSSSPFEAFQWTPLDFAAFSAYGGDFANVRRPVTPIYFFEDPVQPPAEQGPDDEQAVARLFTVPYYEPQPLMLGSFSVEQSTEPDPVPEPGTLMLVGLGLLGASTQLRRVYRNR